ncbi:MAG: histone H1 [Methylotenera sp.]|nr:histone H1 [Methylotenera sp.]
MQKRPKNLDLNQLAKRIVDEAIGDETIEPSPAEQKVTAKKKATVARGKKLTSEQRTEIAKNAANSRWKSKQDVDVVSDSALPVKKTQIIA